MKRIYEILWNGHKDIARPGKPPEGEPKYVFVDQPRSEPAFTHWVWWGEGYLEENIPHFRGRCLPRDQTAAIPVRRVG